MLVGNALLCSAILLKEDCQEEPNLAVFVIQQKQKSPSIQSFSILRVNSLGTGNLSGKTGNSTQAGAPFLALSNYFPSDERMIKFSLPNTNPSVFAAEDSA